jgi:hypothetical protein
MLALHDLTWTATAYALASDHVDALPPIAGIAIADDYQQTESVFEAHHIRHADLFNGTAGHAYDNLAAWLTVIELRGEIPWLRRDDDLSAALAEAELLAALRFAAVHGDRSYCHVKGGGVAERRLRRRVEDAAASEELAALFDVSVADFRDKLDELYRKLVGPDRLGGRTPLFPT